MGEASAATSRGAEAIFLNPAGLATLSSASSVSEPKKESPSDSFAGMMPGQGGWGGLSESTPAGASSSASAPSAPPAPSPRSEMSLDYSSLLQTTYAGAGSYAYSLGSAGVVAAGFLYFSQAPQTAYDALGNSQGSFTPYDLAFALGYAGIIQGVRVGGDVKLIQSQIISGTSGQTEAVDIGAEVPNVGDVGQGAVDMGGSITNLGPGLKLGTQASSLPTDVRGGFFWHAYPFLGFAMDVNFPENQDPYVNLGAEWTYAQPSWTAALRVGYDQSAGRQSLGGFAGAAAGAGLSWKSFSVDYAWAPFSDLGMTDRVSLTFRF